MKNDDDDMPLNDKQYDSLQRRIEILTEVEGLAVECLKTINLFLSKAKECSSIKWMDRYDEVLNEYREKEKKLRDEYISLGGKGFYII